MCRYGVYKEHYTCFACRKMFRQPMRHEMATRLKRDEKRVVTCPQCGAAMTNMGRDFKAPRQADVKQWRKVQELYAHGYSFGSCGCVGPGLRPAKLREVKPFLAEQEAMDAERTRRQKIAQHILELSQRRNKKARQLQGKRIANVTQANAD